MLSYDEKDLKGKSGIYKWTSPSGKSYIGQAKDLMNRFSHFVGSRTYTKYNSRIDRARRKYPDYTEWKYEVLEYCDEEKLNDREIYWIAYYDTFKKGYNMTIGGDNNALDEWRKENGSWNKGKHYSQERKEKMRQISLEYYKTHQHPSKGKKATEEAKEKMRQAKLGKDVPKKYKSVCQYDTDGNFIQKYVSIKEASEMTGVGKSKICRGIKGGYGNKTAGGFQWRYTTENYMENIGKVIIERHSPTEEEREKIRLSHIGSNNPMYGKRGRLSHSSKTVNVYKDGVLFKTFYSAKETAAFIGISPSTVGECCRGLLKQASGYTFEYVV